MASARLTSSQMFEWAFYRIHSALSASEEKFQISPIRPSPDSEQYGAKFSVEGKGDEAGRTILLLNPVSDHDKIELKRDNAGTQPLPETKAWVDQLVKEYNNPASYPVIFVPMAECHGRYHWTLLLIKKEQCYFYDPKPAMGTKWISSFFYSLENLKNYLGSYSLHDDNIHYTNLQSMLDDQHCGYFVGDIVGQITAEIHNQVISEFKVSTAEALKSQFDEVHLSELPAYNQFKKDKAKKKEEKEEKEIDYSLIDELFSLSDSNNFNDDKQYDAPTEFIELNPQPLLSDKSIMQKQPVVLPTIPVGLSTGDSVTEGALEKKSFPPLLEQVNVVIKEPPSEIVQAPVPSLPVHSFLFLLFSVVGFISGVIISIYYPPLLTLSIDPAINSAIVSAGVTLFSFLIGAAIGKLCDCFNGNRQGISTSTQNQASFGSVANHYANIIQSGTHPSFSSSKDDIPPQGEFSSVPLFHPQLSISPKTLPRLTPSSNNLALKNH